MTNAKLKPKKPTKKWIYIGTGLVFFILIAAGSRFYFWNKSKNSNESDSTDQEDEDINPEELPPEIKVHRKKDWTNHETGLWDYEIPENLPTNISVPRAKDELLEALWQWWGKNKIWNKKKIEKFLEKNAQRINLADKKGNKDDPLFETKFLESIAEKYRQNIFSNLPNQKKFEEGFDESWSIFHFLRESFDLKYKGNKKIDWVASLQERAKRRVKNKTKTQQEEDFAKMTGYLEREYTPFAGLHTNNFPSLTSLKELNQWTHILAKKTAIASRIVYARFYLGRRMKKEPLSPAKGGWEKVRCGNLKNEKFGLKPVVMTFKP